MILDGNMVLWLHVIAHQWPSHVTGEYPILINYDMTGHYPILAGCGERGTALYVAAVKSEFIYYFTCVEGGARKARYTDITGGVHETDEFFVLALRRDPTDLTPPYPRIPRGVMDQTGPLFWLRFWPQKDPDYSAASDSAKSDDGHLETILNSYKSQPDFGRFD